MIRCINSHTDFESIGESWTELTRESGCENPFLTHGWLSNWLRHYANDRAVIVLNYSNATGLLLAAAVWVKHHSTYALIDNDFSHYPRLLFRAGREDAIRELIHFMRYSIKADQLTLIEGEDSEPYRRFLRQACQGYWIVDGVYPSVMRVIDVGQPFEAYLATRPSKVGHELQRKRRKLYREFDRAAFEEIDPVTRTDTLFEYIKQVEVDSWKAEKHTAISSSAREISFYRALLSGRSGSIKGRCFVLLSGEQPMAFVIGFVFGSTYYALKTAYRESLAKASPGSVLFAHLIETMCGESDMNTIELLGSDARWKKEIGTAEHAICQYELYPNTLKTKAYLFAYEQVRPFLKKLVTPKGGARRE